MSEMLVGAVLLSACTCEEASKISKMSGATLLSPHQRRVLEVRASAQSEGYAHVSEI